RFTHANSDKPLSHLDRQRTDQFWPHRSGTSSSRPCDEHTLCGAWNVGQHRSSNAVGDMLDILPHLNQGYIAIAQLRHQLVAQRDHIGDLKIFPELRLDERL